MEKKVVILLTVMTIVINIFSFLHINQNTIDKILYDKTTISFDLYTGKESRYERMDVLGTIQSEDLPGWAKHGLTTIQQEQAQKKTTKERER